MSGNRAKSVPDRDAKGRFVKGNTSNGGRKPMPEDFRRCVLENAPDALKTVLEVMRSPSASNRDRLEAAKIVMERAYGKPEGAVKLSTDVSVLESARRIGAILVGEDGA